MLRAREDGATAVVERQTVVGDWCAGAIAGEPLEALAVVEVDVAVGEYSREAKRARTPTEREAAKAKARSRLSPLGEALTEKAKHAREVGGQQARHTNASASRTSGAWNQAGKWARRAGGALLLAGVGLSVAEVVAAPERERVQTATREVSRAGGALAGGYGGAKLGAAIGSAIAPGIGTAIGGFVSVHAPA
jgi:phage tail tape-measure protein